MPLLQTNAACTWKRQKKILGLTPPGKKVGYANRLNGRGFIDRQGRSPYRYIVTRKEQIAVIVIPRKKGESIVIGDNIIVTILDIQGDTVRISIESPPGICVEPREVLESLAIAAHPQD